MSKTPKSLKKKKNKRRNEDVLFLYIHTTHIFLYFFSGQTRKINCKITFLKIMSSGLLDAMRFYGAQLLNTNRDLLIRNLSSDTHQSLTYCLINFEIKILKKVLLKFHSVKVPFNTCLTSISRIFNF